MPAPGSAAGSAREQLTIQDLLGFALAPLAFAMGIPWQDAGQVGALLGVKTVLNEFIAYQELGELMREGALSPRSAVIASYALCGFANFGSLAILLGGLAGLAPHPARRVARLGLRSIAAGSLATFMTACVAGLLLRTRTPWRRSSHAPLRARAAVARSCTRGHALALERAEARPATRGRPAF